LARDNSSETYITPIRNLLVGVMVLALLVIFAVWRIDSPRVERLRMAVIDRVVPSFDWVMAPIHGTANLLADFQSYQRLAAQNQDLRRELQQMKAWREAALQLEQENAKLLDLNNVRIDPKLTFVTGVVMTDSGSPFRQSVLLNVGARDGIIDGWPTMDGIGLAGRIAGVGRQTSRVLLLTDTSSRIPITILPSGQRAILAGDSTSNPIIEFLEDRAVVRPGDSVVSSGDGGVFPADLLVGQVALGTDNRLRVRLAVDYQRLEFLRVLRAHPHEVINDPGRLLTPLPEIYGPSALSPAAPATPEAADG
jgi:rod shape-determining protein MreC